MLFNDLSRDQTYSCDFNCISYLIETFNISGITKFCSHLLWDLEISAGGAFKNLPAVPFVLEDALSFHVSPQPQNICSRHWCLDTARATIEWPESIKHVHVLI